MLIAPPDEVAARLDRIAEGVGVRAPAGIAGHGAEVQAVRTAEKRPFRDVRATLQDPAPAVGVEPAVGAGRTHPLATGAGSRRCPLSCSGSPCTDSCRLCTKAKLVIRLNAHVGAGMWPSEGGDAGAGIAEVVGAGRCRAALGEGAATACRQRAAAADMRVQARAGGASPAHQPAAGPERLCRALVETRIPWPNPPSDRPGDLDCRTARGLCAGLPSRHLPASGMWRSVNYCWF